MQSIYMYIDMYIYIYIYIYAINKKMLPPYSTSM